MSSGLTVSVHIVSWNSRQFLTPLLESLRRQTYPIERILVVDNASTDGSIEQLSQEEGIHVLRFTRNTGFAHAHNQAIAVTHTDAVLITNPDLILEPTCIAELVKTLERDASIGSVAPKLLRYQLSGDDLSEPIRSDTIDAAGMILRRNRQALNRGEGSRQTWNEPDEVFGPSGALALYRRTALNDVAPDGDVFDQSFFAYKEDVDLACRLRWANWRCRYVPTAVAYHHRGLAHAGDSVSVLSHARQTTSAQLRRWSYRNHLLMLMKNETSGTLLPHLPWIAWYELRKLLFILWREPGTLRGLAEVLRLLPTVRRKRRILNQRRRLSSSAYRHLMTP